MPLGPASEGMSKAGISAMQGIDLLEPIKPEEWNTRPEPASEQIEPEKITQADLDAPAERPDEIFANSDPSSPPSEGPVESSVRRQG